MSPKEKARELIDKYLNASFNCKDCDMPYCDVKCTQLGEDEAKQCALIAVDEIMKRCRWIDEEKARTDADSTDEYKAPSEDFVSYWQSVKQSIKQ